MLSSILKYFSSKNKQEDSQNLPKGEPKEEWYKGLKGVKVLYPKDINVSFLNGPSISIEDKENIKLFNKDYGQMEYWKNIASNKYFKVYNRAITILTEEDLIYAAASSYDSSLEIYKDIPEDISKTITSKLTDLLNISGESSISLNKANIKNYIFDLAVNNNFKVTKYRFKNAKILDKIRICTVNSNKYFLEYYESFKVVGVEEFGRIKYKVIFDSSIVQLEKVK